MDIGIHTLILGNLRLRSVVKSEVEEFVVVEL